MELENQQDETEAELEIQDLERGVLEAELYLSIHKYLVSCGMKTAAEMLKTELKNKKLSYMRTDVEGELHLVSFDELTALLEHRELSGTHLLNALQGAIKALGDQPAKSYHGLTSLLSTRFPSIPKTPKIRHSINPFSPYTDLLTSIMKRSYGIGSRHRLDDVRVNLFQRLSLQKRIVGHLASSYCVIFDRTGEAVITGSDDKLIKIWRTRSGALVATLRGHQGVVCDLAISPDNAHLASCSADKTVRVWGTFNAAELVVLHGHSSNVTSVKFGPFTGDKTYLVSTGSDGGVCFWACLKGVYEQTPTKFCEKLKHNSQLMCSAFSPGGNFLVAGASDSSIHVYRIEELVTKIADLEGHSDRVDSVEFNRFGDHFLSTSADGVARVWTPRYSTVWSSTALVPGGSPGLEDPLFASALKIISVVWNLDGRYIVGSLNDHSIMVWNAHTGSTIHRLKKHTDAVYVIEPHSRFPNIFLSAGHDGVLIVWDINSLAPLCELVNDVKGHGLGAIYDAKLSPTEPFIAATDTHGHLCLYGVGLPDAYSLLPDQQFFHTDYRPIYTEDEITHDEQTGLLPHLMLPPYLVNVDGDPHRSRYQIIHLGRKPGLFRRTPNTKALKSDTHGQNSTTGLRAATDVEGVRQTENVHFSLPISSEDIKRWREREIIRPLTNFEANESISIRTALNKDESAFYDSIKQSCDPETRTIEERKIKLLSLQSRALSRRADDVAPPEPQPVSSEPVESSIHTESSASDTSDPGYSEDSDSSSVRREICTRRNRYVAESSEDSSTISLSPPPLLSPSWWLTERPACALYIPQLGDVVVYIVQAHRLYVEHVTRHRLHRVSSGKLCFKRIPFRSIEVCRVNNITFASDSSLCVATLAKLDASGTYSTGLVFNVRFADMPNIEGFLVLKQLYDASLRRSWAPGDAFRAYIDESWWNGVITGIVPLSADHPDSQFQSLRVRWSTWEEDVLSPWDVCRFDEEPPVYAPETTDWAPETPEEASQRIIAGLETLQVLPQFADLQIALTVRSTDGWVYLDLCKIMRRCQNGFYRRKKQVVWDLRAIMHSIEGLGLPSSIHRGAIALLQSIIKFVKDVSFDISELVTQRETTTPYSSESDMSAQEVAPELKWVFEAHSLLNYIFSLTDAQPFLNPVDTTQYLDYLSFVKTPMDLSTVSRQLLGGSYLSPDQFVADMRLVFQNSRLYNTNRRSNIYGRTLRLNTLFNKKIDSLLPGWQRQALLGDAHLTRRRITRFLSSLSLPGNRPLEINNLSPIRPLPIASRLRKRRRQQSSASQSPESTFRLRSKRKQARLLSESFEQPSSGSQSLVPTPSCERRRKREARRSRPRKKITSQLSSASSTMSSNDFDSISHRYDLRSNPLSQSNEEAYPYTKKLRKRKHSNYNET